MYFFRGKTLSFMESSWLQSLGSKKSICKSNPALGVQFHVLPEYLVHWYIGVQFHVLPEDHYLMFCPTAADDLAICLRFAIAVFPNCLLAFITSTI